MPTIQQLKEKFMDNVFMETNSGCWLWEGHCSLGYGYFSKYKKNKRAHRISWELYKGEIPEGLLVLHKCDVTQCVNPDHLFIGTQKDNMQDMVKKGRRPYQKGEDAHNAKLNNHEVRIIRRILSFGTMTQKEIGKIFGVTQAMISMIKLNRSWSSVR